MYPYIYLYVNDRGKAIIIRLIYDFNINIFEMCVTERVQQNTTLCDFNAAHIFYTIDCTLNQWRIYVNANIFELAYFWENNSSRGSANKGA